MKKYETLDGKLFKLNDYNQYSLGGGWALSLAMLDRMVHHGIIRERKMTFQELLDVFPGLPYRPAALAEDSILSIVLQRIIDKGLVDQILADD